MKNILSSILICFLLIPGYSQVKPKDIIDRIPALPDNPCKMTGLQKENYKTIIFGLIDETNAAIQKAEKEEEAFAEANAGKMRDNMARKAGADPGDIARMQKGEDMTDEEAMRLASKMLEKNMNLSMEELENLEKMDEAGQEAWAKAYGTEVMAEEQANPQIHAASRLNAAKMAKEANEQQLLLEKLSNQVSKYEEQFTELEQDTSGNILLKNIRTWASEYSSLTGIDYGQGNRMDELAKKIIEAKQQYCQKFTPRYFDILGRYKVHIQKYLPDYQHLVAKTADSQTTLTGVKKTTSNDLAAFRLVLDYLQKHQNLFLYCISDNQAPF